MYRIIKWTFIPMFIKRWIYKCYHDEVELLDILTRLDIELKMFAAYSFKDYTIRAAGSVKVTVFTANIKELVYLVLKLEEMLMVDDYVTEHWKTIKFNYGSLSIDEFFSLNGYDLHPKISMVSIVPKLNSICSMMGNFEPRRRTYYLRHTKPVLEDSIEIISRLRSML
jgi:hypothetical protein